MALNNQILGIVTLCYLCLFLIHLLYFATKKERFLKAAWIFLYVTFGLHTVGIITRWIESYAPWTWNGMLSLPYPHGPGHAPLSNFYESLIFYAWCITLTVILLKKKLSVPIITGFASLIALFCMGYASLSPAVDRKIEPLIPALQSNWLTFHVFTCFIAYAAFAISFLCGLFYLIRLKIKSMPTKEKLEEMNYQSIMVGFPMLTAGILTGAVWAHYAWGAYWSWDPKETWSLITWIVYALFLHARFTRGWRGRRLAVLSVVGFLSVIFTYVGVNFVLSGLHSYGSS